MATRDPGRSPYTARITHVCDLPLYIQITSLSIIDRNSGMMQVQAVLLSNRSILACLPLSKPPHIATRLHTTLAWALVDYLCNTAKICI